MLTIHAAASVYNHKTPQGPGLLALRGGWCWFHLEERGALLRSTVQRVVGVTMFPIDQHRVVLELHTER